MLENEKLSRGLLNRRQFLAAAGAIILAASPLSMIGCGGAGGSRGGGGHLVQAMVQVTLPQGSSLVLTTLTVLNGLAEVPITDTGLVGTTVPSGVPSLVTLSDPQGNAIYMGFVDPSVNPSPLDATSTAVALLFFLISGPSVPADSKQILLNSIQASSAVPPLAAVIAERVAVDPKAISDGDSQIASALQTAYNAIGGGSQGPAMFAGVLPATLPDLLVQPSGPQSGFEVVQDEAATAVHGINHFRRRCEMLVYRVSETSSGGTVNNYPQPIPVGDPIFVNGTTALGLFSTIENLLSGDTAFVPVTTSQILLHLNGASVRTDYEVIVLGASAAVSDPSFYSDSKYSNFVAGWKSAVNRLNVTEAFFDVALGFILEMWGIRSVVKSDAMIAAFVDGLYAIEDVTFQTLLRKAETGAYSEAITGIIQQVATSDLLSQKMINILKPYITALEKEAVDAAGKQLTERSMQAALAMIQQAFTIVGVAAYIGDLAAIAHDVGSSNEGDRWTATVFKPSLNIDPKTATIAPGARKTFTVSLPGTQGGNIVYDWSQSSTFATFSSPDGTVGNSIETASTSVDLVTTPSDSGTLTINVIAYLVGSGGSKTELGRTSATVTFSGTLPDDGGDLRFLSPMTTTTDSFGLVYHHVSGWAFFVFKLDPGATTYTVTQELVYPDGETGRINRESIAASQITGNPPAVTVDGLVAQTVTPYHGSFFKIDDQHIGLMYQALTTSDDPLVGSQTESELDANMNGALDYWWNHYKLMLVKS